MRYANYDAPDRPQVVSIRWEMVQLDDDAQDAPDERQDGFWPSLDPDDAGYIGADDPAEFDHLMAAAQQRMDDWRADRWNYVGVIARAHVAVPIGGGSFTHFSLDSAGLWGIESDSGADYFAEVFEDEKAQVIANLGKLSRYVLALEGLNLALGIAA